MHPTDRWARSVCAADDPQDSAGRQLEEDARARLFGVDTLTDTQDGEGRDLEDQAYARLFGGPPPASSQSKMIGRYALGAPLGGGGMGDVFLATDTRLVRKVAIKLLRARNRSEQLERDRLLREAQALAKVEHRNVVYVFECGLHEESVYLAMEYVEGTTLRAWQDEEPRSWREVLAHYLAAGRGLAAIHAADLVHRDFKPQNVLVSRKGEVKITDFGLAVAPGKRARRPEVQVERAELVQLLATQLTSTSAVLGTPLYISPEQLSSAPVDARSDQFSFCVALYEALYGSHPYAEPDAASTSRATTAGRRSRGAVGTTPSGPPSMQSLVTGLIDGPLRRPPKIVIPGRLYRAIERGLSRDPNDRYPSMEALLADLERDPLRKYGPWAGVAGLGFGISAALFAPATLGVCKDIDAEFDAAWSPRQAETVAQAFVATGSPHAKSAAERVRRTLDGYRGQWIAARQDNCEETQAHARAPELLGRRDVCLNQARGTVAAIAEQLARADAATVEAVADTLALLPPLEQCSIDFQARQTCLDAADDPALRKLLDRARALEIAGKFQQAEAEADTVLASIADHPRLAAEAELLRGRVLAEQRRAAEAAAAFGAAYDMSEQSGCDALAFEAATRRAKLVALNLELPAATGLTWSEVARSRLRRLPPSKRLQAEQHSDLGLVYQHREDLPIPTTERLSRARTEHEAALALRRELAGDEKTLDLAISELNLGVLTTREGDYPAALARLAESLALYTAVYGPDHPALWKPHQARGHALLGLARLPEARAELERAIALAGSTLGPRHGAVGILTYHLAVTYAEEDAQESIDRALELAKSALAIYERELSERDPQRAELLVLLGQLHTDRNEPDLALPYRQQAVRLLHDADSGTRGSAHVALAVTLGELGRAAEALEHLALAEALFAEHGSVPPEFADGLPAFKADLLRSTRKTDKP